MRTLLRLKKQQPHYNRWKWKSDILFSILTNFFAGWSCFMSRPTRRDNWCWLHEHRRNHSRTRLMQLSEVKMSKAVSLSSWTIWSLLHHLILKFLKTSVTANASMLQDSATTSVAAFLARTPTRTNSNEAKRFELSWTGILRLSTRNF